MTARLAAAVVVALATVGTSCSAAVDVAVTADATPTPTAEEMMTGAEADVPPPVLAPTPQPAENQCDEAQAELARREEAGTFVEPDYEEFEDEAARPPVELPTVDTAVAPPGARPEFAEFPEAPVVADATDDEILRTVERCWETGLLSEEELDEDD